MQICTTFSGIHSIALHKGLCAQALLSSARRVLCLSKPTSSTHNFNSHSVFQGIEKYALGFQHALDQTSCTCIKEARNNSTDIAMNIEEESSQIPDLPCETMLHKMISSYANYISSSIISSVASTFKPQELRMTTLSTSQDEANASGDSFLWSRPCPIHVDLLQRNEVLKSNFVPSRHDGTGREEGKMNCSETGVDCFASRLFSVIFQEACKEVIDTKMKLESFTCTFLQEIISSSIKEAAAWLSSPTLERFALSLTKDLIAECMNELMNFSSRTMLNMKQTEVNSVPDDSLEMEKAKQNNKEQLVRNGSEFPISTSLEPTAIKCERHSIYKSSGGTLFSEEPEKEVNSRMFHRGPPGSQDVGCMSTNSIGPNEHHTIDLQSLAKAALTNTRSVDYPEAPPPTPLEPTKGKRHSSFTRKLKGGLAKEFLPSPPPPTPKEYSLNFSLKSRDQKEKSEFVTKLIRSLSLECSRLEREECDEVLLDKTGIKVSSEEASLGPCSEKHKIVEYADQLVSEITHYGTIALQNLPEVNDFINLNSNKNKLMEKSLLNCEEQITLSDNEDGAQFVKQVEGTLGKEAETKEWACLQTLHKTEESTTIAHCSFGQTSGRFQEDLYLQPCTLRKTLPSDGENTKCCIAENITEVESNSLQRFAHKLCQKIIQDIYPENWGKRSQDITDCTMQSKGHKISIPPTDLPNEENISSEDRWTSETIQFPSEIFPKLPSVQTGAGQESYNFTSEIHVAAKTNIPPGSLSQDTATKLHFKKAEVGHESQVRVSKHLEVTNESLENKGLDDFVKRKIGNIVEDDIIIVIREISGRAHGSSLHGYTQTKSEAKEQSQGVSTMFLKEEIHCTGGSLDRGDYPGLVGITSEPVASNTFGTNVSIDTSSTTASGNMIDERKHNKTTRKYAEMLSEVVLKSSLNEACRYCSTGPNDLGSCSLSCTSNDWYEKPQLEGKQDGSYWYFPKGKLQWERQFYACEKVTPSLSNSKKTDYRKTDFVKSLEQVKKEHMKEPLQGANIQLVVINQNKQTDSEKQQLQIILQWAAASQLNATRVHFLQLTDNIVSQFPALVRKAEDEDWTVGGLLQAIQRYCEKEEFDDPQEDIMQESLLEWLLNKI
nr:PREDICTED: A-kinase anchor protein 4 [Latimeria chalumnae]|eukprot:XP_005992949.2 PREDICTED: A-kinase anchor protein 4 [Latimeria chalumnae]